MAQINPTESCLLPEMGRYGTLHIKRWMLFERNLSGMALLLYALIYQTRLTTKKEGWTVAELSKWFDKDQNNIRHTLNDLVEKGFLTHESFYYSHQPLQRHRFAHRYTEEERKILTNHLLQQAHIFE